jgi:hypothetical protein
LQQGWPASPHVFLGLSPHAGAARPAAQTKTTAPVTQPGVTRQQGRDTAREFAQASGEASGAGNMYIECARENPTARRTLFPMLIGCATAQQYFGQRDEPQ